MLARLLFVLPFLAGAQGTPTPAATCRSIATTPTRTWRVEPLGDRWQIAHWTGDAQHRAVRLKLPPTTDVRLSPSSVQVKGRTSNGGIDVSLTGSPARALLDVYVSYELEVNVDASLTPSIDELNTEGTIGVHCEIH